jgi:hypothetical protein
MTKERYDKIIEEVYGKYIDSTPSEYVAGNDSDKMNQLMEWKGRRCHVSGYPILERLLKHEFIHKCKTNKEFSEKWGLKIEERELSLEESLPKKIKLKGYADEMEFSLTDKREIKFYGITKESNESLERAEKLKDNEVFYQTEFGWGVFLNTDTFETISYDGTEWGGQKLNIPTKQIIVEYKIEIYE